MATAGWRPLLCGAVLAAAAETVHHQPVVVDSHDGVLDTTLVYGAGRLALGEGRSVAARCYNGSVPGPHLRVRPGDVLRIRVVNALGEQTWANDAMNEFRLPNTTNLHTHGLHTSPVAPGDEVRVAIAPGGSFQYEYHVPRDHAPGLHWYHPHFHGSAALQVFTGGYGLLEVLPGRGVSEGALAALPALTLPIQFLHFNGEDSQTLSSTSILKLAMQSRDALIGGDMASGRLPLRDTWLVQGRVLPTYELSQCATTRLRVVFASAGSELFLEVRHPEPQRCAPCTLSLASRDGHQLARSPRPVQGPVYVPPGGRADVLIRCPAACGGYVLTNVLDGDLADPTDDHTKPLARFNVRPERRCAAAVPPLSIEKTYAASYTPDLLNAAVPGDNVVTMSLIDGTGCRYKTRSATRGIVDDWFRMRSAVDTRADMELGRVYEVRYTQDTRHPYHQHVYPFQIVRGTTYAAAGNFEPGDYVDSVMFWNVTMRFRPHRYPGVVMFHCHLIAHEDNGCMAQFAVRGDPAARPALPAVQAREAAPPAAANALGFQTVVAVSMIAVAAAYVHKTRGRWRAYASI
eukprot:TRINITY_DN7676_c0_g2_i1.p1 TRINITY_DN7676_c0_g2~~TRINITY_DN7676_c0_g2_i1.p1  ORF type:complete len:574 (+),score=134.57 TRINITY_DN7676_c0_g2_i1:54-1775(+)